MLQSKNTNTGVSQLINDIELISGKDPKDQESDQIDSRKDDLQLK